MISCPHVLERIVCDHIVQFASTHKLIPKEQHRFPSGRSTMTNLLNCLNDWTRAWYMGVPVYVLYSDFSRALDKVPHRRLLHNHYHLGFRGKLIAWIEAFLSSRSYEVSVGDSFSTEKPVTSGIPRVPYSAASYFHYTPLTIPVRSTRYAPCSLMIQ